jgi:hypothetical protein
MHLLIDMMNSELRSISRRIGETSLLSRVSQVHEELIGATIRQEERILTRDAYTGEAL